jgi:hypothetical protein
MGFLISMLSTIGASALKGRFSFPAASKLSFLAGESPILRPSMADAACDRVALVIGDAKVVAMGVFIPSSKELLE